MDNIHIRPLQEEDARTSFRWRNDPEIWRYTGSRPDKEITYEIEKEWIKKVINEPTSKRFAIISDEAYVGNIYLTDIENGTADYHIFIGDKNYWGKGIARKATELIIAFGRDELGLDAIELEVKRENAAAYHLYETFDFQEVGQGDKGFVRMRLELKGEK